MDTQKLIKLKKDYTSIGKEEVDELETLVKEFPYFGLAQILLAKGYKNVSSYKLDKQLKLASLYCEDREWLYKYMHDEIPVETSKVNGKQKKPVVKLKVEPKTEEVVEVKKKRGRPPKKKEEPEAKVVKRRGRPKKVESTAENAKVEELSKSTKKAEAVKVIKEEKIVKDPPKKRGRPRNVVESKEELNTKKEVESNDNSFNLKKSKAWNEGEVAKKKPVVKKKAKKETKSAVKTKVAVTKPAKKKPSKKKVKSNLPAGKKVSKKDKQVILDDKALLDELMRQNITYRLEDHFDEEVEKTLLTVEAKGENSEKSFFDWLEDTKDPKEETTTNIVEVEEALNEESKSDTSSIIDNFLSSKPKITRKKADFYSPAEMARISDQPKGEIVTETLAEIYVSQGQFNEAKSIYEQLILLFPQKETYFAALIQKIEGEEDNK